MMLVDTGAVRSICPLSRQDRKRAPDPAAFLTAANGSPILSYGTRLLSISILGRGYSRDFVIVDQWDQGAHHLLRRPPPVLTAAEGAPRRVQARAPPGIRGPSQTWHLPSHKNKGPPAHARFQRLPPRHLQEVENAFAEMERMGICKKASSLWASPLHMVQKPDGSWRHRRFNLITEPDHYPLPNMQDLTASFHWAKIFSKLDLLKSYFISRSQSRQRMFRRPPSSCLSGPMSHKEHQKHIQAVLQHLQENDLVVRFDKCTFGVQKADFLGHRISPDGVRPLTSKVAAFTRFPVPTSVKAVQEFLRMVNYYRRFIPGITHTMAPLTETLKGQPKSLRVATQPAAGLPPDEGRCGRIQNHKKQYTTLTLILGCWKMEKNPVEDALSRVELNAMQLGINYEDLARDMPISPGGPNLLCDVSTGQPHPLVPASHRCQEDGQAAVREVHLAQSAGGREDLGVLDQPPRRPGPHHNLSELWSTLARLLRTTHHTTTASNPTANGLVKRFHRSLKASLMARCTAEDWKYQLPADGAPSAAEKTYGKPLVVPGELVTEDHHNPSVQRLHDIVGKFAPCKPTYTDRSATFTLPCLSSTTHVFDFEGFVADPDDPMPVVESTVLRNSMGLDVSGKDMEELVEVHREELTTEELQDLQQKQQQTAEEE
ncbi:uncharacterized protein [Macrobrachium rosenbergii]|uniref:uncharacterized protein n=1 Tax=Macrobrachium rosenbergii TaxID=79674 RepID=UPI0034D3D421